MFAALPNLEVGALQGGYVGLSEPRDGPLLLVGGKDKLITLQPSGTNETPGANAAAVIAELRLRAART